MYIPEIYSKQAAVTGHPSKFSKASLVKPAFKNVIIPTLTVITRIKQDINIEQYRKEEDTWKNWNIYKMMKFFLVLPSKWAIPASVTLQRVICSSFKLVSPKRSAKTLSPSMGFTTNITNYFERTKLNHRKREESPQKKDRKPILHDKCRLTFRYFVQPEYIE